MSARRYMLCIPILLAALATGMTGCGGGPVKYSLSFERGGFETAKTSYAPGEEVTVYYQMASDTDYRFSAGEDIKLNFDYDPMKGMKITFPMPERDVVLSVDSKNTMTFDPSAIPDPSAYWTCPECGNVNEGKYCSECGLEQPKPQS